MKTMLTFAAVAAALASASIASAQDTAGGHWEWRTRPTHNPKSYVPDTYRVWVKDGKDMQVAKCDCPMMKDSPDNCMMNMPGKAEKPSAG
ncbi:MAG: hypothetical protein U1E37_07005 [Sphingomonadaceae bacterium]